MLPNLLVVVQCGAAGYNGLKREKSIIVAAGADWAPFVLISRWPEAPTCAARFADRPRPRPHRAAAAHCQRSPPFFASEMSISLRGPVARASRISCVAAPCPAARGAGESA